MEQKRKVKGTCLDAEELDKAERFIDLLDRESAGGLLGDLLKDGRKIGCHIIGHKNGVSEKPN